MGVLTLTVLVENCNLYHTFPLLIQILSSQITDKTKNKPKKTNASLAAFKSLILGFFPLPSLVMIKGQIHLQASYSTHNLPMM